MHAFFALSPLLLGTATPVQEVVVPYEKFVLENGLEVVIHEDHSDPVVAVYVYYHVGSGRETIGRSGFAHLFEHMLFQGSQHVGDDAHFKLVSEAGGTLNGSTTTDRTNYYEVLPSNQLELALWLESDRMGFFLPAITQAKLDNQREVVKNERRQNYENRPYGQAAGVISAALYPPDHPYSWLTIGSQEDLTVASLDDVKEFFARWYGPNNATLAIGGDVDTQQALALVETYFGGIPRGPSVDKPLPRPVRLGASKRIHMEDKVKLAELQLVWPAVPAYSEDDAALDLLAAVLSANKSAILDEALTIASNLASMVSASNESAEIAGSFSIRLRSNPGVTLDTLEKRTDELLRALAEQGVDPAHLQRVKNRYEADMIRRAETVQMRTGMLANYNTFLKDPGYFRTEIARHMAVSADDVKRVLRTYVVDKPRIALSVVPQGKTELAASGSKPHGPWEAPTETAVALDRTRKPEPAPAPTFRSPKVWHDTLANGIPVTAARWNELPISTLSIAVPAGQVRETMETLGLSSLVADMLEQGTRALSAVEYARALDGLGATIRVGSDDDEITLTLGCLDKHLPAALAILGDVLLRPRFAPEDFERLKKERLVRIDTRGDQIRTIAGDVYRRLLWGDSVLGRPGIGTRETVASLNLADVQGFWRTHGVPEGARVSYVGAHDAKQLASLLAPLVSAWKADPAAAPLARAEVRVPRVEKTRLYLVDKPGAAQSEIRIGHLSVASTDPSYYALSVVNYALGGAFSSRINLNLREDKGYTYGARSTFEGGLRPGPFTASAAVRTDVTGESVVEFMKELASIREGLRAEELASTKDALLQGANRQYESTGALVGLLDNVAKYGYPDDYVDQRLAMLRGFQVEELSALGRSAIDPGAMVILVVGDKAKIAASLSELGWEPIELDIDGNPIAKRNGSQ